MVAGAITGIIRRSPSVWPGPYPGTSWSQVLSSAWTTSMSRPRPTTTRHIDKQSFTVPFVCWGLAVSAAPITIGVAMIRSGRPEPGISNAVTHTRTIRDEIRRLSSLPGARLYLAAKELAAPATRRAGVARADPAGVAPLPWHLTSRRAAVMMQMSAEASSLNSGVFAGEPPSEHPPSCAARCDRRKVAPIAEVSRAGPNRRGVVGMRRQIPEAPPSGGTRLVIALVDRRHGGPRGLGPALFLSGAWEGPVRLQDSRPGPNT